MKSTYLLFVLAFNAVAAAQCLDKKNQLFITRQVDNFIGKRDAVSELRATKKTAYLQPENMNGYI